ncbi:MAG TPA: response regulator [Hyphomicrobiaceae bacterium]|nr:response regulator [Hyphomicrobiaceae bacterium]
MSLAESIAAHIPHLRRFARLLTGSQGAGDAAVERVLQAVAADPSIFPDISPRLGLYQCFLSTLTRRYRDAGPSPGVLGHTATRSLAALTPQGRQAFLLVSVEGFSPQETAQILEVSEQRVEALLGESGAELGRQIATAVLVIEDEPLIALELRRVLEGLGHSVSIARTHADALQAAKHMNPGLVIADIRLADGSSGLDAVNELLVSLTVPVIFVTAFPERLTTGRRPEPAFLIPKPFRDEAVKATVSQALFFDRQANRIAGCNPPAASDRQ